MAKSGKNKKGTTKGADATIKWKLLTTVTTTMGSIS
jgi:hypothetical protein